MLHISLIPLVMFSGVLVEPFRVAEAEPSHHQVRLQAAMRNDGRFAIAWVDSVQVPDYHELNLFIRFFNQDGNPLTDAYQITKLVDTNWIHWPCLEMDSVGNAVLVWAEAAYRLDLDKYIRFQAFGPDGSPAGSAQALRSQVDMNQPRSIGLSLANNGEFALIWSEAIHVWVQRFDAEGNPKNSVFLAHDSSESWPPYFYYPEVALNDAGDVVVTWLDFNKSAKMYPRFQVFDANDESVLPWEPFGHPLDDGDSVVGACRPEPHWLDDDRFVVFWSDYMAPCPTPFIPILGRVFSDKGLTRHSIKTVIWGDSLWSVGADPQGQFCTAVSPNDSFTYTHMRSHYDYPDTAEPWKIRQWEHGAGILGEVVNNEPWRRTTLFEYTPPWGADTIDNWGHAQAPTVACCNDRIVWVYSRFNPDTIFEAYALITDWDMGVGVVERPPVTHLSNWQITSSVGSQIVLRYQDSPDGFHAFIFDAAGRKVDELHSSQPSGVITWGECYGPGVYFVRTPSEIPTTTHKVILID